MNKSLKEMIAPRWIEEQQGVYIPLIDKVLLKDNVPKMPYDDYMRYAKDNNVKIATKEELLQMYLQKEEINIILKEHNGDLLDDWFASSSEYGSPYEWLVHFGSGYCYITGKYGSYLSRAVVAFKEDRQENSLHEYEQSIDWEQRRYEIAKAALVGQLASPIVDGIDPNPPMPQVTQWAVKFADALIEELKK